MRKYVLDTNLYIRAFRDLAAADELRVFYATFAPGTYLSSVVLHELLVGASSSAKSTEIHDHIAGPFRRTGRFITPTAQVWETAGDAIATMARREHRERGTLPRSLMNDYLLAASCHEAGAILITENVGDFKAIHRDIKVRYQQPWPA